MFMETILPNGYKLPCKTLEKLKDNKMVKSVKLKLSK